MNQIENELEYKIKVIPEKPGVYLFKDENNKVLYVGKAKSLKKRVRSYFTVRSKDSKVEAIQKHTTNIETITTQTETEALILENSLIKLHRPRYNVRLMDDKTYPFLLITTDEEFPRVEIVRRRDKKHGIYFGPFTDIKALKTILKHALTIFPIASCKKEIAKEKFDRPCLYYQLKKCTAPCVNKIDVAEYGKNVKRFISLFEGKVRELLDELKFEMDKFSKKLDFEKAAIMRDRIKSLEKIIQRQAIVSNDTNAEYDIIESINEKLDTCIQLLSMRGGRITEQKNFIFKLPLEILSEEIVTTFVKQYYSHTDYIPNKIITSMELLDEKAIDSWLHSKQKKESFKSIIIRPNNEEQRGLLKLASDNASEKLHSALKIHEMKAQKITRSLKELKDVLSLENIPNRIEGYDISTIQGTNTVASCVVFEQGLPKKESYRKFIIKSLDKQDDFSAMKEVIHRRFTGSLSKKDPFPDLILIDGGIGQVNSAHEELDKADIEIQLIGITKEFEELHKPGKREPIILNERSEALKLLQRIRDESHRFAISFHKQKRSKKMLESSLEKIPNLGVKRTKNLLEYFETIESIKRANISELIRVNGINRKIAENIYNFYRKDII